MRAASIDANTIVRPILICLALWFLFSLYCTTFDPPALRLGRGLRTLHGLGLALPWQVTAAVLAQGENRPRQARTVALVALVASVLLTLGAAIRMLPFEKHFVRALLDGDMYKVGKGLSGLSLGDIGLLLNGPTLALAAWWLLRSPAPAPHRPGSRVPDPGAARPR